MKKEIQRKYELNINRVRNLVIIYDNHLSCDGKGRRSHQDTDVLRAATVMLHASLEEVLRSLAYWKLPHAKAEILEKISLVGEKNPKNIHLGILSKHRGKTVDDLIKESIDASLERSNYNNTHDVFDLLKSCGISPKGLEKYWAKLEEAMKRRHHIVHRADVNLEPKPGRGNHKVETISPTKLNGWIFNTDQFVAEVLKRA
jgi:hypothetical protein